MRQTEYPFQPGDLVKCNYDFIEERARYKWAYPKRGDYLTVSRCLQHEDEEGTFVLLFNDHKLSIPLAADRFDLVQDERDGDVVLNEVYKIANNL